MALSNTADPRNPMAAMNMAPLIDVLLVLLIMFVVTIPVTAHSLEVDIGGSEEVVAPVNPVKNVLALTSQDEVLWNGASVSLDELATLLKTTAAMKPEPELQFEPEAQASYEISAEVLRLIKLSGVTKFGFIGNEKYSAFDSGG